MKISCTDYGELEHFARGFATGGFRCLIVQGAAGLGKSRIFKKALGNDGLVLEGGKLTGINLYKELYYNIDRRILLDDIDSLYCDRTAIAVIKAVCNSELVRTVSWHSSTYLLKQEDIPINFESRSNICIIANDWRELNKNITAVENRGFVIQFKPLPILVHDEAYQWFKDKEILRFVGKYLYWIPQPSFRYYTNMLDAKNAGLDWRRFFLEDIGLTKDEIVLLNLQDDGGYPTEEARAKEWCERTGKHRATYFRHLARLKQRNLDVTVPPLNDDDLDKYRPEEVPAS
jgi:hypothetical protein